MQLLLMLFIKSGLEWLLQNKAYKGIRKENLRDNITDIKVALTNIGEIVAHDIALNEHTKGLGENIKVASRGGRVANGARHI